MTDLLLHGGTLINEGCRTEQNILSVTDESKIWTFLSLQYNCKELDVSGKWILPGLIDDQVHFREPGLTHKACIHTESQAAVAGGVTTISKCQMSLPHFGYGEDREKCAIAKRDSLANYAFFLGASNENLEAVKSANPEKIAGVKVFMDHQPEICWLMRKRYSKEFSATPPR